MKFKNISRIICLTLFIFIFSSTFISATETTTEQGAKTRLELLEEFIQDTYLNDSFSNEPNQNSSIESTYYGVLLSDYLKISYDIYDIIFYIQKHQKSDYGFSNQIKQKTTINATFFAVQTLKQLSVGSEDLNNWQIFQYLNKSISEILYNPSNYVNLTTQDILTINRFFLASSILNETVLFSYNSLINALKQIQFTNGTFPSFYYAVEVSSLLSLFEQLPADVQGTIRYLKSFRFNDTGFTKDTSDIISIKDTYYAISTIYTLGGEVENKNKIVDAILDLQAPEGGFMDKKGQNPTLESSYFAYQILLLFNSIKSLDQLAFLESTGFLSFNFLIIGDVSLLSLILIRKKRTKKI
ncbi:MAG: prenyltransferase/squalene oxidase repeat-containing protein [Candidatus Heimdallarchaeaceae archaeon]